MVIDSSVIIAILLEEPTAEEYLNKIAASWPRMMSTATFVECGLRLVGQKGPGGLIDLQTFVLHGSIQLIPVEADQALEAVSAFERYGKGRHPAALNFGDCFSYALAKVRREPLFYQGNDFSKTDLA